MLVYSSGPFNWARGPHSNLESERGATGRQFPISAFVDRDFRKARQRQRGHGRGTTRAFGPPLYCAIRPRRNQRIVVLIHVDHHPPNGRFAFDNCPGQYNESPERKLPIELT
jgi:hypothetical protein